MTAITALMRSTPFRLLLVWMVFIQFLGQPAFATKDFHDKILGNFIICADGELKQTSVPKDRGSHETGHLCPDCLVKFYAFQERPISFPAKFHFGDTLIRFSYETFVHLKSKKPDVFNCLDPPLWV